ncbi:rhomboid family intramembrane serine protease [Kitasatospora sp. NPDC048540]|uniref:rhomboid family intramembrane serine protease n=1 Tax=unclassified Kitasatospora TaxID=2633591 RepID=UPI00053A4506|nr:rhomboid family intramembrane serine protease [Kitasatospora sp. MBT63]
MNATHAADDPQSPEVRPDPVCFRHPQRESHIRCTRCERYICPDCMRDAAVGYQCPECVKAGNQDMRPVRTQFGGRVSSVPFVTYALIALNVLAYLAELARKTVIDDFCMRGLAVVGPDGGYYRFSGYVLPPDFHPVGVAHGEWYRLISSAFLHQQPTEGRFGIAHILMNMFSLWVVGRVVEERLGALRYLAVYLLSALGGSALVYLLEPTGAAIGASGAIFGLTAAYFVLSRRLHHDPLGGNRQLVSMVIWLVVSAGITSWQGHLGGLLTGLATGAVIAFAPAKQRGAVQAAGLAAVLMVLVMLVVLKTVDLTDANPWLAG